MPYTLKPHEGLDVDVERIDYTERSAQSEDRWVLNFGPQHPATHTTLRIMLELDGERVVRCTPHIGYLHSGFEKLAEHHDYNQYVTVVSRMDYLSPISNDIAWHGAVESLFGIGITPRCKVLRTIMAELGRIQNHLLCAGAAALDLGGFTAFLFGFNPREKIYDICDYVSGQRFHPDWTRVGGLMMDLPDEAVFKRMVKDLIDDDLPQALKDMESLVLRNRIFVDRLAGVGVITKDEAINWSLTGPMARAWACVGMCGRIFRTCVMRTTGTGRAKAVEFKVPIAEAGDAYAGSL